MPRTSPLAPHLREIQARRAAGWPLEAIRAWLRAQRRVTTSVSALSRALTAAAKQAPQEDLPPVLVSSSLYVRPRTYRAPSHSVAPLIRALAAEGMSARAIAAELTRRGHRTSKSTVARVLKNVDS